MSEKIPLNPVLLKWARETIGYSVEDVVEKIKRKSITSLVVEGWEDGTLSPSYPQLEMLAYTVYKRPLAIFFFPEPPEEKTPEQSFRTLPREEINLMGPSLLYLIRRARVMQENLYELYEGENPAKHKICADINLEEYLSVPEAAMVVRKYLGADLEKQYAMKRDEEALGYWRNLLEDHGVFVFKDAFDDDECSGFCLDDKVFPIIYVNNSQPKVRQIFTLFHELAHLLFKTGGVDLRHDDFVQRIEGKNRDIEIFCNQFAGEFLVPTSDIQRFLSGKRIEETLISELAKKYCVSREVILRKCLDLEYVSQTLYESKVKEWETQRVKRPPAGANKALYYPMRVAYLGERYIETAFRKYYKGLISKLQLAEFLDVKERNISRLEDHLLRRSSNREVYF
ncbi:MAG TPA: ImmA/IrrE family metallo-endopeptidase [Anaerohalosphaeraceae bacterium]|nr:ImmA/IrrE family metallo-endopeptidase [Anaerohalosphaeraceae bacterium]HQG06308.1 ImmA/IrrE family metallo-endopeptidase [Anaerohalosphaeraceae bacterium]HQI07633.1 ImmA/IrrE family metallo-endopeptidase [Anaerohalosphaeraceae bacterium]HQJ67850.1 ImmA/IrrE family metallo-endopeptidase [Anaerohalosphaeraceae bacterium]